MFTNKEGAIQDDSLVYIEETKIRHLNIKSGYIHITDSASFPSSFY
jgi:hypothetical protein